MATKMTSGLPTPPTEESKPVLSSRRSAKQAKPSSSRGTKRNSASLSLEHGGIVLDGRHKRVWKACERCRMKKTKCDGESPCKRCKDDGLVCTAGSRKKTEFKQLPRGYAEVLENTQYALIATVQKLYTMVRNGESWDLGEPELNDRGLPVIHNIAEKLGCIRPSPDMPQSFPEDAEEFAELQAQLFAGKLASGDQNASEESISPRDRTERASSSDSDRSALSKDYNQMLWSQQQSGLAQFVPGQPQFTDEPLFQTDCIKQEYGQSICENSITSSPVYSDFQSQHTESPFSPWSASASEDFLGPSNILDLTNLYMRQQQQNFKQQAPVLRIPGNVTNISGLCTPGTTPNAFMRPANAFVPGNDGTIRPHMLDYKYDSGCNPGMELVDQMDNILFGEYEAMTMG